MKYSPNNISESLTYHKKLYIPKWFWILKHANITQKILKQPNPTNGKGKLERFSETLFWNSSNRTKMLFLLNKNVK